MLILTRRVGETVMIGNDVTVTVLGVKGNQVRVGINAPKNVAVHREEIFERIKREQQGEPERRVRAFSGIRFGVSNGGSVLPSRPRGGSRHGAGPARQGGPRTTRHSQGSGRTLLYLSQLASYDGRPSRSGRLVLS